MGDAIVLNALFRRQAKQVDRLLVLCKMHNYPSVEFMLRDLPNVFLVAVRSEEEANKIVKAAKGRSVPTLELGLHKRDGDFDKNHWDLEFYRKEKLDPEIRWKEFYVERDPKRELKWEAGHYVFVHDNSRLGYTIPADNLPKGLPVVRPNPEHKHLIWDYWHILEHAIEAHCIDSCFAAFADYIKPKVDQKLVLHRYVRPTIPITPHRKWIVLV